MRSGEYFGRNHSTRERLLVWGGDLPIKFEGAVVGGIGRCEWQGRLGVSVGLDADQSHHGLDVELHAVVERILIHQVALVDDGARESVGPIVVADRSDGDVELDGIEPGPEDACFDASRQDASDEADELAVGRLYDSDPLRCFVDVGLLEDIWKSLSLLSK